MIYFIKGAGRFIKNRCAEFVDIYVDEAQIRESYGDEYADRFSAVDPVTGKRRVSAAKIVTRVFIVLMVIFGAIVAVRLATYDGIWGGKYL